MAAKGGEWAQRQPGRNRARYQSASSRAAGCISRANHHCTRKISSKDPLQIVLLKGIFSGLGSVCIGLCIGERLPALWSVPAVLAVGLVAYGLSIYFYVYAQRMLGAARTSAYYAVAPFIAASFRC